jgi:hypothetical protein
MLRAVSCRQFLWRPFDRISFSVSCSLSVRVQRSTTPRMSSSRMMRCSIAVDLHLGARVLAEEDAVALLDVELRRTCRPRAPCRCPRRSRALDGLLLRRRAVGDDDPALDARAKEVQTHRDNPDTFPERAGEPRAPSPNGASHHRPRLSPRGGGEGHHAISGTLANRLPGAARKITPIGGLSRAARNRIGIFQGLEFQAFLHCQGPGGAVCARGGGAQARWESASPSVVPESESLWAGR